MTDVLADVLVELRAIRLLLENGNRPVTNSSLSRADRAVLARHGLRGDLRPDKEKAGEKIDGIVSLDMALAIWVRQPAEVEKKYSMMILGAP